jgi:TolA-binding protein
MLSKSRPLPPVLPSQAAAPQSTGLVALPSSAEPASGRLQLDSVDISSRSGVPSEAETSGETSQTGAVTLSESGQAEPVASESDRQLALQQEVAALRAEQERMRLALETLNSQLRDAEASQSSIPWLYGAFGLAILSFLGYWFVLRSRQRTEIPTSEKNGMPWWESALAATPAQAEETRAGSSVSQPSAPLSAASSTLAEWSSDSVEGMELAEGGKSMPREVAVAHLELERLQDLWQQVEFCASIGQYRDAMSALQAFVTDGPRASEAPYLMWLKIANRFGTDADLSAASTFYESHFLRLAPDLAAIESPMGLDDDTFCIQSLVRDWPNNAAREWLVASLRSQPGDGKGALMVRTLQAFDDLIMLIGMLDILPTLDVAPSEPVTAKQNTMLEDLEMEFPTWESVADMPASSKSETGRMPDFDLPAKPASQGLDFDLFLLDPHNESSPGQDPAGGERKKG